MTFATTSDGVRHYEETIGIEPLLFVGGRNEGDLS